MSIQATLRTESGTTFSVIAAALFNGLCRFPQLFVVVESDDPLPHAAYSLTIDQIQAESVQTPLLDTLWHTLAIHRSDARHLLWLSTDPSCLQQVRPFGANDKGARDLLAQHLGRETVWNGVAYTDKPIEALISQNETLEQLARRVASYVNDVFVLRPNENRSTAWGLHWGSSAGDIARSARLKINSAHAAEILRSTRRMEAELQRLSVPISFGDELLQSSTSARLRQTHRPVQLGQEAAVARTHGPALNETGANLEAPETRWFEITQSEGLRELWQGGVLSGRGDDARTGGEDQDESIVVSSLFLYDNGTSSARASMARNILIQALGCESRNMSIDNQDRLDLDQTRPRKRPRTDTSSDNQGWFACGLAVPLSHVPADKILLESIIEQASPEAIWSQMVASIGCSLPDLGAHLAPPLGPMMAIVVNDPSDTDPIARTEDKSQYRTKIWVRPLGCDSNVLVDWATPFASHGGQGDLVLVPTAKTLGFLMFQRGHGAPMFFASTHYRDVPVSASIEPQSYKHGLATEGGLLMREVSKNSMVRAHNELRTKAQNFKEIVGG